MKICIVVDDYLPASKKVAAKMMHELAIELNHQKHEITVITPDSDISSKIEMSELDSIKICKFKSGSIKNVSKIQRAINESLLSFKAWIYCNEYFKNNPHDLILYYSPSIFWGPLIRKLKKLWNVKSYLILRDFYPQMFFDEGLIKEYSLIGFYFKFFEWVNYKYADIIGIESPKNLEWFNNKKKSKKPCELLYNWASDKPVTINDSKYRNMLNLNDKVVYFYGGNIGPQHDMPNLIRLVKSMEHEKKAHFVITGQGFAVDILKNLIKQENLTNITYLPSVPQDEFKIMLSEFDIGLFTLNKDHTTHNIPGKLLGYMVQEMPILGSINMENDIEQIIGDNNAGLISITGDDKLFLKNALLLLNNKELRDEMGKNAKRLLKNTFSVEEACSRIIESCEN
jgi:glycosyltransferase involved in cell wall biosynthesis